MTHLEKLMQQHIEAAKKAGLPGTAEVITSLLEIRDRLATERDNLSSALTKLAGQVLAIGTGNVPGELNKKVDKLLKNGDLAALIDCDETPNMDDHEDQQTTFRLPNNATIDVWLDEKGQLQVCATSLGTKLAVLPVTQGSVVIQGLK